MKTSTNPELVVGPVNPYADTRHRKDCRCGRFECAELIELSEDAMAYLDELGRRLRAGLTTEIKARELASVDLIVGLTPCRYCSWFKRRSATHGVCWADHENGAEKDQHDTCARFERRCVRVSVPSIAPDLARGLDFEVRP